MQPLAQTRAPRNVRTHGAPRPIPLESKLFLNYEEVASLTGVSLGALRRMVREGKGPKLTIIGKHHRFHIKDVNAWADEMRSNSGIRL